MSKNKKESFFWASYSDLMTSLFFVMLALFVLTVALQHSKIEQQAVTIDTLERLTQIDRQFEPLVKSGAFVYYSKSKKFVAKDLIGHEIFDPNKTEILPQFEAPTIAVGKAIDSLLKQLPQDSSKISYQLVIEGNVANKWDKSIDQDETKGYKISYERALAVYLLWLAHGIDLRSYNTEILICGSGFNGMDRDSTEENNKRFSIQIIPKISSPKEK
ncbi:MAG: hypothetical protein LBD59_09530 [Prevotellaceae bacterium]|jgi:hypothetical protein|nr:hypothetical protein [Prevotellaceae bacterium]